ncbi:MAG TPA: PadR family transcriptional regulator [Cytophagales bacterium]|nr:PadR family transcriptional regulator [Cytophagales bacterium]
MKGTNLGEFEEVVLLVVGILYDDAYGVAIKEEINQQTGRSVTLSSVHAALNRLLEKGFLASRFGEPSQRRGGKRKKLFTITASGMAAMQAARAQRDQLWNALPQALFNI